MKQPIPNCFYRVSIKALILDETKKKFLVAHEKNEKWTLLGGGLEWGERVDECLARELKEEAGFKIVTFNPSPAYIISGQRDDGKWAMDIIHEVIVENLDFIPSNECLEIRFVTAQEAKNLSSHKPLQLLSQVFDPTLHKRMKKQKDIFK
jgi:8-oxo-dGTP diphosphatase